MWFRGSLPAVIYSVTQRKMQMKQEKLQFLYTNTLLSAAINPVR